jgi:hypothetical protein
MGQVVPDHCRICGCPVRHPWFNNQWVGILGVSWTPQEYSVLRKAADAGFTEPAANARGLFP